MKHHTGVLFSLCPSKVSEIGKSGTNNTLLPVENIDKKKSSSSSSTTVAKAFE